MDKKLNTKKRILNTKFKQVPLSVFCVFVFMNLLILSGCAKKDQSGVSNIKRPVVNSVTVITIQPVQVDKYYQTSGTVTPEITSSIASRIMGNITSVNVKDGQFVYAGQTLLIINNSDLLEKVKEAKKFVEEARQNLSLADVTYKRYKELYNQKVITPQEMDKIRTHRNVANMQYKQAKINLSYAKIYYGFSTISAPISGIVSEKNVEVGDMAVPGVPMLTIENTSWLKIKAYVDERFLGRLRVGMPVYISTGSKGKKEEGMITELVPSIDPMTRTFLIKIQINNSLGNVHLQSGLYVKVYILVGKKKAILVPQKAIIRRGELTGVYAVNNSGIITYRLVRTGEKYNGKVEILSGLNPSDKIITGGIKNVVEGGIIK